MTYPAEKSQGAETHGQVIRVRDSARILEFDGRLLSEVSTETSQNPRWTEMALYKTTDGTGRYVLAIIGRSVIYHVHDGRCNSGVPTKVGDLDDNLIEELEPCVRCDAPQPENLAGTVMIDLEEDRHTVHICDNAGQVIAKLRNPKSVGQISGPGQRLIGIAAAMDADIMTTVTAVDRI